jgi:biotin-(acetyl-CoA carboxylase) ligase
LVEFLVGKKHVGLAVAREFCAERTKKQNNGRGKRKENWIQAPKRQGSNFY